MWVFGTSNRTILRRRGNTIGHGTQPPHRFHRKQKVLKGYHAIVRPRLRPDIGVHNAFNMAIWPTWTEAVAYCIRASEYYYGWDHGISDCTIEPWEGMVDC